MTAAGTDNLRRAIGAILVTVLALSLGDALIKGISANFSLWQIFVIRSIIALPVVVLLIRTSRKPAPMWPRSLPWTLTRNLLLAVMWIAYYCSLPHVDLSVAAAAFYTLPLFITLFSACGGNDRVSRAGWFAVTLGFAGVVLILKPSAASFNAYALLPLGSAICYAVAMILTRSRCRDEHPLALSLNLNLVFIVLGLVATAATALLPDPASQTSTGGFLFKPWISMGPMQWVAMALLAIAILVGSIGTSIAYQSGPPAVVSTFDFAYVAFAVGWGILFFGELPDAVTLLGIALVTIAGIIAVRQNT